MKKILAAVAALLCATAASADVLVDNVNGYTLTAEGRLSRFAAMLVGDDGKVERLYQRGDKKPDRTRFRFDGKGKTLIPGLIDAHGHVMGLGFNALQLDLSETNSLQEAQAKIAAYAAANPSPRWIVGRGWNQEKWGLGRFPTAADLDAIVPNRPIWLERIDGHAGWANSLAMKEAGVTAKTAAPAGGKIEKTGTQPNGIFVDAATGLIDRIVPSPVPLVRDRAFQKAQELMLSNGLTAAADMGTSPEDWLTMRRAGDAGRLKVRIMSYAGGVDALLAVAGTGPTPWLYDGRLRMGGVKLYSDGALGSRGAWLKQPYKDSPKERGLTFLSDAEIRNLMSRAAMDGFQVAVHAIGDAANAQLLGAIEELADSYKGDRRWRIEHAQIIDPADLPRLARFGTIASMQPVHEASDWRMAEARLGMERLGGSYAWKTMLANGVPLAFGSDFPVESPNPFHGLAVAVSRQDAQAQPPGGWMPEQRLSLEQALRAFTQGAAYAGFAEDRIGSLEKGKFADFVLIDRDIFADASPEQIRETKVVETWIAGNRAWPQ
ncbi:amidohydrolase [Allosphingosinicella deserti]|uniref:Metal-dependent hydrolase n=1 Tax=Allosphingosinicella deserti TaxID=2116704 RepID=A0A2P7QG15_9SPHN|nr:amidohydrolase [Sphingomonas deserti]PSJ36941.1 metal-dependent hydrolase [Sphingomonas deserti]